MPKIPGIDHEFDEILSMDDPNFIENFKKALGLEDGDKLEIATPQFDRTDGRTPADPQDVWERLNQMPPETLKELGCCAWDEPDKDQYQLWQFPAEWYNKIPKGFLITDINGQTEPFEPGVTDDDRRFGVLPYGVKIRVSTAN